MSINYGRDGRARATIPSPLVELFDKPDKLKFVMGEKEITVRFERTVRAKNESSFENKPA